LDRAAERTLSIISEAPPLALLAVVAALFELALARLGWHGLPDVIDLEDLRQLRDLARFPRNLAAVSGLVALIASLLSFLKLSGHATIGRRLVVATFSGVFVPSILVATVLPYASVRARLVVFSLAAANVLITLLAMTAARYRPAAPLRLATGLLAATAFLSLSVVGLGLLMSSQGGPLGWIAAFFVSRLESSQRALLMLRHLGEVAWMVVLVGGAMAALQAEKRGRNARFLAAALILLGVVGACLWAHDELGHRFRLMIFGAFRLGLFLDQVPTLYAVPLGIGLGGGVVALTANGKEIRQLGMGLLLWLAAGYAPHTSAQLLYLVLGAMLISRSAQARDPSGAWRQRHPWLRLMQRIEHSRSSVADPPER